MSFSFHFDYRYDSDGFFDDPDRRAALDAAAAEWAAILNDEFTDVPVGTVFSIKNPTTFEIATVTLSEPIDDILVFVGSRSLPSGTLALAGPDGGNASGDVFAARISPDFRGSGPVTDFEPWAGSLTFNSQANWSFALDGPVQGYSDFFSVVIHELGHILGIGSSGAFDRWVTNSEFAGPNAVQANGGRPIPLEEDHAHIEEGYADDSVALDPILTNGSRVHVSDLDKAILADIGYQIAGFEPQGTKPPIATNTSERVFGTVTDDRINGLDGNDSLQGAEGHDQLFGGIGDDDLFGQTGDDTVQGGPGDDYLDGGAGDDVLRGGPGADVYFGHAGRDVFVIAAGDGSNSLADFDFETDIIQLIDSGFSSTDDVLAAVFKPFNNVSRVELIDGTTLDVLHRSQSGTPLTEAHFQLEPTQSDTPHSNPATDEEARVVLASGDVASASMEPSVLLGTSSDDVMIAMQGHTHIDGLEGVDTVQFAGNQTHYTVTFQNGQVFITDRTEDGAVPMRLDNIERIAFALSDTAFDEPMDLRQFGGHVTLDQAALDVFIELYVAYFNRAPDALGLGFWGTAHAQGMPLAEIAGLFANQDETRALYDDDMNALRFVSEIYQNVLGRAPDMDGLLFWTTALESGAVSRSTFVLELLQGAKADTANFAHEELVDRQADDQQYLALKTELGTQFAIDRGMSDLTAASLVLQAFDGSTASFDAASALIESYYQAALDPVAGAFLMPLIGMPPDENAL